MSRQPYPKNRICPCGSGKKYKRCCSAKGLKFSLDEDGSVQQDIPISKDLLNKLKEHIDTLPEGEEMVFPGLSVEDAREKMTEMLRQSGVREEIIYAFHKTDRIVTAENRHHLSDLDLQEWQDAVDEYRASVN